MLPKSTFHDLVNSGREIPLKVVRGMSAGVLDGYRDLKKTGRLKFSSRQTQSEMDLSQ